ncbi:MAG: O-acetyl-ADP-ribose deacetylase [Candidatus Hydrogenedentota bacterium]
MSPAISIVEGDITAFCVDAIVNAANDTLLGGGGVDGAIHRAAGPALLEECRLLGGCATGDARITNGGNLPAQRVIHTVGPVYTDGSKGEAQILASCYRRSLELAVEHDVSTIAFPAISCGVYGYPVGDAAEIALAEVKRFLKAADAEIAVTFVLFSDEIRVAFEGADRHT